MQIQYPATYGVLAVRDWAVYQHRKTRQTATQLQMWQSGFRGNSPTTMTLFAKLLDDREIAALAAYYQQVGLPAPSLARQTSNYDGPR